MFLNSLVFSSDEMAVDYKPMMGKEFFGKLRDKGYILHPAEDGRLVTILAANVEHDSTIRGVMEASMQLNSPVIFEYAYAQKEMTGLNPKYVAQAVERIACDLDYRIPYILHADHVQDLDTALEFVAAGYTSFSIDCSRIL